MVVVFAVAEGDVRLVDCDEEQREEEERYILEELGITASLLNTLQLSIGLVLLLAQAVSDCLSWRGAAGHLAQFLAYQLLDVAVHGIVNNRNLGSHLERLRGIKNLRLKRL